MRSGGRWLPASSLRRVSVFTNVAFGVKLLATFLLSAVTSPRRMCTATRSSLVRGRAVLFCQILGPQQRQDVLPGEEILVAVVQIVLGGGDHRHVARHEAQMIERHQRRAVDVERRFPAPRLK